MKRHLFLAACAAVVMSGCRSGCSFPWWGNRGAPCTSSISFDSAPAAVCGIDGFGGEVTAGYPDCPDCGPGFVGGGGAMGPAYYDSGTVVPAFPEGSVAPSLPRGELVAPPAGTVPSP
jgi:hypothetical protein